MNEVITATGRWDEFRSLRSENLHANGAVVLGIRPFYFWLVCELLDIDDAGGSPLVEDKPY